MANIAQFELGLLYTHGSGVPQNHNEALYWYRKASVRGSGVANYNIGLITSTARVSK
ncbi:MAG: sel1 repeat family protein [Campylobacteraceae bacterium]|nr:sel1 repeat family protein [Campylobacteraceae bacterium]